MVKISKHLIVVQSVTNYELVGNVEGNKIFLTFNPAFDSFRQQQTEVSNYFKFESE